MQRRLRIAIVLAAAAGAVALGAGSAMAKSHDDPSGPISFNPQPDTHTQQHLLDKLNVAPPEIGNPSL